MITKRKTWWPFAIIGWTIFGAIIGTVTYARILTINPAVPWWPPFLNSVFSWGLWAFLMPLILSLGKRFRISSPGLLRNSSYHLLFSIILCTAVTYFHTLVGAGLYTLLNNESFWPAWENFGMPSFLYSRIPWLLSVYWMILGLSYAIEYFTDAQDRKIKEVRLNSQLAQTTLMALRRQLQPHFLFNTLHSITSLIQDKKNEQAINMITRLSDLLRITIDETGSHEVRLENEMEFIGKYLDTERVRFSDRLTIDVDIDPDTKSCFVPRLVLQPLVENAFRHGIERKRGQGLIKIRSYLYEENLVLTISDNGGNAGLTENRLSSGNGIGLQATRDRLKLLYDDKAELTLNLESEFETLLTLKIPFHTSPISIEQKATGDEI